MTITSVGPGCRYILAGPFRDASRWAARNNLSLREWAHHSDVLAGPEKPTLRVYALIDDSQPGEAAAFTSPVSVP